MSAQLMSVMEQLENHDHDMIGDNNDSNSNVGRQIIPGILFTLVVLSGLSMGAIKLADPATLPVRHVSVSGDFMHLSPYSLEQRASDVVRGGFFNVNVETIQRVLMQEPWVREVSVKRVWPDRITVNIREQDAVAQWGEEGLLNPEAKLFFPDRSTFPADLPVLSGPDNAPQQVLDHLRMVGEIIPEGLKVRSLQLSERRSWTLVLDGGLRLRLGKTGIIDRIRQFFEYYPVGDLSNLEQIQYIDMRYTNGFVIRWNPEMKPDLQNRQDNYGKKI